MKKLLKDVINRVIVKIKKYLGETTSVKNTNKSEKKNIKKNQIIQTFFSEVIIFKSLMFLFFLKKVGENNWNSSALIKIASILAIINNSSISPNVLEPKLIAKKGIIRRPVNFANIVRIN